jgi:hypothetical protein
MRGGHYFSEFVGAQQTEDLGQLVAVERQTASQSENIHDTVENTHDTGAIETPVTGNAEPGEKYGRAFSRRLSPGASSREWLGLRCRPSFYPRITHRGASVAETIT